MNNVLPRLFAGSDLLARRSLGGAKWLTLVALALAITSHSPTVGAAGSELANVDKAVNNWKTLDQKYKITTTKAGSTTTMKLRMRMKASADGNKQFTEISAPSDMKGTKVLIASPTKMYIYLPAYKKVRRIASHVTEQGFLGTALSQRDMNLTRYGIYYTATVKSQAGDEIVLNLAEKAGANAPYARIEMTVSKKTWLPSALSYFNADGKKVKAETRKDYRCENNYCAPGVMKMTDLSAGVTSTLKLKRHKVNPKLKKGLFSKRQLLR